MMTTFTTFWRKLIQGESEVKQVAPAPTSAAVAIKQIDLEIAPNDPLLSYLQNVGSVVEVERLMLDSPAVAALKEAEVKLVVPLVSQGELIGLINLGGRLSEQEYSRDDHKLLSDLATQAAPALRVAQLVEKQKAETAERERIAQELRVARLIQQTLLPKELPDITGWFVDAYYQPAREVGGDFYDFIHFPDGKIGVIVADVTDKGVPAALVMATTRSILRSAAERLVSPGAVLKRTNDVLHPQIPPKMFVTCFYALLDPVTGKIQFANAGHDVPYRVTADGIVELRATGMPLGLLPGMAYEEKETILEEGEYVLLYSDGLVEAHAPDGEMFGFPRLQEMLAQHTDEATLTTYLLDQLAQFTGHGWEQEDDVTMVTLGFQQKQSVDEPWKTLKTFEIESKPDNERIAMNQIEETVVGLSLPQKQLERLKTAVAEATMNAMEHGNQYDPDKPVHIAVATNEHTLRVSITDQGVSERPRAATPADTPDLDAKLAGEQSPRGWGLFLIKNMVDEMVIEETETTHTVQLKVHLKNGT